MISLREFAYEIRLRIDEGRTAEAIPLAQYLLRRHPRYLRGYQLLAEAALEAGNLTDAIEIFSRVQSADPESFPAYAGLASAYTDRNELDNALWYMTRAFEIEPGMKAVREQLRFLYELRDGRAPGRLHPTSAALARNHLRNGAYDVAATELARELEQDPDRIDLRVALAEAYWFANRPQDAAEMAYAVLEELPLAFKPHLILASFYYQAGELEKAEIHLRIAQDLDPENEIAVAMFGEGAPFRALAIPIDEPENIEKGTGALSGSGQLPEWLRDLSLFAEPEAPIEGVDWDAVIAHEEDWRTRLAAASRAAVAEYRPDWRVNLRVATGRALRERPGTPQPAVSDGAAPSATEWREQLRDDTAAALPVQARTDVLLPSRDATAPLTPFPAEWASALRFATEEALAAHTATAEPVKAPEAVPAAPAQMPRLERALWHAALREGTEAFIESLDGYGTPEVIEFEEELEPVAASYAPEVPLETAPAPRQRSRSRWIPTLRVATEIWLAMQRRGAARRRPAADTAPDVLAEPEAVRSAGVPPVPTTALEAREEPEAGPSADLPLAPAEAERAPEPEPTDVFGVEAALGQHEADETRVMEAEELVEPAEEESVLPDAVGFAEAQEVEDAARAEPDIAEPAVERIELVPTPDTEPVEAKAPSALEEARMTWQGGGVREAMSRYQMLFLEESVPNEELSAALSEWAQHDSAPALLYQLLGEVYRRMGRMEEAVAHYREAINRL